MPQRQLATARRLRPRRGLPKPVADAFREIVAGVPAGYFGSHDVPQIEAYAASAARLRDAISRIDSADPECLWAKAAREASADIARCRRGLSLTTSASKDRHLIRTKTEHGAAPSAPEFSERWRESRWEADVRPATSKQN